MVEIQTLDPNQLYRTAPQIENNTYFYNEKTGKYYFKAFLMNNLFNKRKFGVTNVQNLHRDIDGYENLPLTLVEEGPRKGNHPNPKDGNIFEANYQNKYTYVTKAIDYYRTFGVAKIIKIFKPDLNLLTASDTNVLNYHAFLETDNPKMIARLEAAKKEDKKIFVSPAMFSWDWKKDPETGHVHVNSFVPTHLAIVDSPAYDPEMAYIKKETCQKDGMSCYYQLLEASDIENLNNNNQQTSDMSTSKFPATLEEYVKSYWNYDVVDQKNINAEDLVKNMSNYIIVDKSKVSNNNNNQQQQEQQKQIPIPPAPQAPQVQTQQEESKPVQKEETTTTTKKSESKSSFTLDDVRALLAEQKESILKEIKAEQTKGQREQLLDSYIQNEKVKGLQDKIDKEKLNKTKELYNGLPLDNDQLKTILDNSIYNPQFANPDIYTSLLAISEENREANRTEQPKQTEAPKPQGAPKNPIPPKANLPIPPQSSNQKPITDVPAKPNANINMFGTEFKSSADNNTNKYNDEYKSKGKDFTASKSDSDYRPVPTTGEGIPKRFQKYIN